MFKRLLVAGITGALLLTSTPSMAQTSATGVDVPWTGVQFHGMWSDYTWEQRLEVLDKMAAAGMKWIRVDMGWGSFQEQGPNSYSQWYVDRADRVVNEARARGLNVLATIWWTPGWANGNAGRETPPTDPADYGRFAGWAAEHFKGRVAAWEIWNEPNDGFFKGTAADYTKLLKAAYPTIKAADPAAQVVFGGPTHNDTGFIKRVYEAGGADYFDVMATHPYQGPSDLAPEAPDDGTIWRLSHVAAVHNLMKQWGDGDKKIWFTEFGWSTHPTEPGAPNWMRGVSLQQQADYMVRALRYIGDKFPYVTNVFWYNERDTDQGNYHTDNFGLLYRDLTPKPSYIAVKQFLMGNNAPATPTPTATPTPAPTDTPTVTPVPSETPTPSTTPEITTVTNEGRPVELGSSSACRSIKPRWKKQHCLRRGSARRSGESSRR